MLARTPKSLVYLSADELGITPAERAGLIEVRDDLVSGRVKHTKYITGNARTVDPNSTLFNMADFNVTAECGTAHCIAGFMIARGYLPDNTIALLGTKLEELFYADNVDVDRSDLKVDQAVRAIDNFLVGAGDQCWVLALADEPA